MSHDHHHHQSQNLKATDINTSFIIGIGLNSVYVIIELIYGWKINSTALLSDAVHNIGDISGLLLAFLAFKLLKVKANNTFSYGLKKGSVLASFINTVLLAFAIGAIAWEGMQHIIHPVKTNGNIIMIVAAIGIVINFGSALLFRNKKEQDLNIKAAYWHLMADALVSLGVVVAGLIIKYTQWYIADGVVALIVAAVILLSTWRLFKDSIIGILDGTPTNINTQEITQHLKNIPGVQDVHHMHIWSISTNENGLTCHIVISDLTQIPMLKKQIKAELESHNISHSTLEFETNNEPCKH
jgi:cobalt-zinc-cadmium efflux system protein